MKTFRVISALLAYPTEELLAALPELAAVLDEENLLPAEARDAVARFIDDLDRLSPLDAQERYVGLFDRNRSLSLHIYEHVHGESRDRGQAMIRLATMYGLHGFEVDARELPDYLPLFLEFLSLLDLRAARSFLTDAAHVLSALRCKLKERGSTYAGLFEALESLAARKADLAAVKETIAALAPESDDLAVLDRQWEEEAVRFVAGAATADAATPACGGV